jgi:non-specific serine/threonine protein kinase
MAQGARLLKQTRLLTLKGPGGVGKTRLSLRLAAGAIEDPSRFPGGVWLVQLAALSDPLLVPQAIGGALGVREQPGVLMLETLAEHVGQKRVLLVLDNCEHLIEACAAVAFDLLQVCPGLTVLATSREPLRVPGETVQQVPPLSLPDAGRVPPPDRLCDYEAIDLFVERACRARPDFELTAQNAPSVLEICTRLDGVPLAIELAAALAGTLPVEEIAARIGKPLELLTQGSRVAMPRHQSLRAVLDWSHDLLDKPERALFRRLAVFVGGWDMEAAEAVVA